MFDIFEETAKARRSGESFVLATIVRTTGSTPATVGSKMIIKSDGTTKGTVGGGCVDGQVRTEALKVLHQEKPTMITVALNEDASPSAQKEGLICGGEAEIFLEPVVSPSLHIFGAGHVSVTTAAIAKMVGFRVAVYDDRPDFANTQRFPTADDLIVAPFGDIGKRTIPEGAYIVIVTRGHTYDASVLEWAVKQSAHYVGMIGSKAKVATTLKNLEARGVPADVLRRVHAPIGLEIDAQTTDEIAIAIVAQLVQQRRKGNRRQ